MTSHTSPCTCLRRYLLLPALPFLALVLVLELTAADLRIADWIYEASGGAWALREGIGSIKPLFDKSACNVVGFPAEFCS